jgi:DNA-binding NtrC family response regulator
VVDQVRQRRELVRRAQELEERLVQAAPDALLETSSPTMRAVLEVVSRAAASEVPVLLRGESGTGKEVLARTLHVGSPRAAYPFVVVNCPTLSEDLLASELFGHAKGAFTGALRDRPGRVETAEGGTLFLDEIGEMPGSLQAKLLRFLQDKQFERVGDNLTRMADVRLLAATNRDLEADIKAGHFREDLYYRLSVVEIRVPPLRDRWTKDDKGRTVSDVALLIDHYLTEASRKDGVEYAIRQDARVHLEAYSWPGNVREMANVVEHLTQLSRGREINPEDLPAKVRDENRGKDLRSPMAPAPLMELIEGWNHLPSLDELERRYIQVLLKHETRKSRIAEILGKDRTTLYRKLKDLGLGDGDEA